MSGRPVILPSQRTDWNTPKWIVDLVRKTFGTIDLDPCDNARSIVPAITKYRLPERDGLVLPWPGNVYVNPPYGRGLDAWFARAAAKPNKEGGAVIMLVPAAPSRKCWQRYVKGNTDAQVCFLSGRVRFLGAPTGAAFGSAVILWSGNDDLHRRFAALWQPEGLVMEESESHAA